MENVHIYYLIRFSRYLLMFGLCSVMRCMVHGVLSVRVDDLLN